LQQPASSIDLGTICNSIGNKNARSGRTASLMARAKGKEKWSHGDLLVFSNLIIAALLAEMAVQFPLAVVLHEQGFR
jgi:hypothetical protein